MKSPENIQIVHVQDLSRLAGQINAEHAAIEEQMQAGMKRARQAGELLIQAKVLVPHGEWLPWIREHCRCSVRTAQAYMRVASRGGPRSSPCPGNLITHVA